SPRRAGVSSFGVGGTNGHVVLEEAPLPTASRDTPRATYLFPISAKTPEALDEASHRLSLYAKSTSSLEAADVAFTLQLGRVAFPQRRVVIASEMGELAARLSAGSHPLTATGCSKIQNPPVTFMFPGQGAQHPEMGRELY